MPTDAHPEEYLSAMVAMLVMLEKRDLRPGRYRAVQAG